MNEYVRELEEPFCEATGPMPEAPNPVPEAPVVDTFSRMIDEQITRAFQIGVRSGLLQAAQIVAGGGTITDIVEAIDASR